MSWPTETILLLLMHSSPSPSDCLRERWQERIFRSRPLPLLLISLFPRLLILVPFRTAALSVELTSPQEPIRLGKTRLTLEEKEQRFRERRCLYCGACGHQISACIVCPKDGAHR